MRDVGESGSIERQVEARVNHRWVYFQVGLPDEQIGASPELLYARIEFDVETVTLQVWETGAPHDGEMTYPVLYFRVVRLPYTVDVPQFPSETPRLPSDEI
jgi:hypothetical protein